MRRSLPVEVLALVLALARFSSAQPAAPAAPFAGADALPFTLVHAEGQVDLARATGLVAAQPPDLLDQDDRVVTREGRAELAGADGTVVHLDRATDVRIDAAQRLRVVRGRVVVHTARDSGLAIGTPAGLLDLEQDGEYEVAARDLDGDTEVATRRGRAVLASAAHDVTIAAGDGLRLDPRAPEPRWTRAASADAFVEWSRARLSTAARVARREELPAPIAPYAAELAAHGAWSTLAPYGPVWFPAAGAAWRPYTNGSWRHTRYGWTWVDSEPWAWPVHHYGRWGRHDTRGWYWIPQPTWGPAWVGWAIGVDHVAWAPLGWDARPVVDFFAGVRAGPSEAWASSWAVLPRRSFGHREPVARDLQDPRSLPGPVLGGFVSQLIGPRGPAGEGDRFAARPAWPARSSSTFDNPSAGRDVMPRGQGPVVTGPIVPAGERRPFRRPGDAPRAGRSDPFSPPNTTQVPPAAPSQYRERPAAQGRGADSIRPRYEPPPSSGATGANAPPPSAAPAPVSGAAPAPSGGGERRAAPRDGGRSNGHTGGSAAGASGGRRRPG